MLQVDRRRIDVCVEGGKRCGMSATTEKASKGSAAARAKARWSIGFVVFLLVLFGVWWLMKVKFDADVTPESYSQLGKFEKSGVPSIEANNEVGTRS